MNGITAADREAAKQLCESLADISGFWYQADDDGPLCQALARHRIEAEHRLSVKLAPFLLAPTSELPARQTCDKVTALSQHQEMAEIEPFQERKT